MRLRKLTLKDIKPHWTCGSKPKLSGNDRDYLISCPDCDAFLEGSDKGVVIQCWNNTFGCDALKVAKQI